MVSLLMKILFMSKEELSLLEILIEDLSFVNWAKNHNQNDVAFWNNWIRQHPDKIETVYNAKAIILGIKFNKTQVSETKIDQALSDILALVEVEEKSFKKEKKSFSVIKYMAMATTLVLFISLAYLFIPTDTTVTHTTLFGEIIDLKLPDGTSVILNGNSEISYDKNTPRNINLSGEAYFKVKSIPSTKAKFWVNTRDLKVEVFGTQFHVSTRNNKTGVLLDEGRIELLLGNGTSKKMKPGELVSYSNKDKITTHDKVTQELSYSLWREGTYIFNNTTVYEVMKNIEQAYGLKTEFIDEELKGQKLTGGIPNQNLKICLSAIEKSTGTRIVVKDNRLIMFKN
ncbi:FecR family protein [Zobellia uliginosa]|uniref:FecR family protein n=1 Tax=Zobellia uliginosa TaxID=143224 RepID=A0ABY1KTT9_9FLAO|nr:FecR family protein [Zobellia uliginosa]SIS74800.1 FecR family protein [Zobellia uliginosa]